MFRDAMPSIPFQAAKTILLVCSLFLAACQAVVSESGNIIEPGKVDQIHIGQTHRDEVIKLLGPPTLVNTFREERWIYIQDRQFKNIQRTFSRVTNRIEITFDTNGQVRDIQRNFNDTLYDPRNVSKENEDKGYTRWLFGGEFSKPVTDAKPDPAKEPKTNGDTEERASWSLWPWNKKEESTSPKPEGEVTATPSDPSAQPSVPTEPEPLPTGKYEPALTEELAPRPVLEPGATPPPADPPAPAVKPVTTPPPVPSTKPSSWWRFWSR